MPFPIAPAVYRFEHRASGFVYVGATIRPERRQDEWHRLFTLWDAGKRPHMPLAWFRALSEVGTSGWDFVIVERFPAPPALDGDAMWRAENAEIDRVRSRPEFRVLNTLTAGFLRPAYARLIPSRATALDGFR